MSRTVKRLAAFKANEGKYGIAEPGVSKRTQLCVVKARADRLSVTIERVDMVRKTLRNMLRRNAVDDGDKAIARFILAELTRAILGKREGP